MIQRKIAFLYSYKTFAAKRDEVIFEYIFHLGARLALEIQKDYSMRIGQKLILISFLPLNL